MGCPSRPRLLCFEGGIPPVLLPLLGSAGRQPCRLQVALEEHALGAGRPVGAAAGRPCMRMRLHLAQLQSQQSNRPAPTPSADRDLTCIPVIIIQPDGNSFHCLTKSSCCKHTWAVLVG